MSEEETYPESAISSWSGFVYQGKVALYHCLKLIEGGEQDFELQLDSTDDFAIYKDGKLKSSHQVKAKVGKYRSAYQGALEKSAAISGDRIQGTKRFFHISVEISDTKDYTAPNKEVVKFYDYNGKRYCGLGEIEPISKELVKRICQSWNGSFVSSENTLNLNYCLLSERISSKAIEIHKKNQVDGLPEDEAAYKYRISSMEILDDLLNKDPYKDIGHYSSELRKDLYEHLEVTLDDLLPSMSDAQYERARHLFDHLQELSSNELQRLCQMIKPSESFSKIQQMDIERYSELIKSFCVDPIFKGLPHYRDQEKKFYLPTAISLVSEKESKRCTEHLRRQLSENRNLISILFEYNNLIAAYAPKSFKVDSRITEGDEFDPQNTKDNRDDRITKLLSVSVLTMADAESKLNA